MNRIKNFFLAIVMIAIVIVVSIIESRAIKKMRKQKARGCTSAMCLRCQFIGLCAEEEEEFEWGSAS